MVELGQDVTEGNSAFRVGGRKKQDYTQRER